jgi:hypothetical protein
MALGRASVPARGLALFGTTDNRLPTTDNREPIGFVWRDNPGRASVPARDFGFVSRGSAQTPGREGPSGCLPAELALFVRTAAGALVGGLAAGLGLPLAPSYLRLQA